MACQFQIILVMDPPDNSEEFRDDYLEILENTSDEEDAGDPENNCVDAESVETPPPRLSIGDVLDKPPRLNTGVSSERLFCC